MTLVIEEADLTMHTLRCRQCPNTIARTKERLDIPYAFCSQLCANKWRHSLATILTEPRQ